MLILAAVVFSLFLVLPLLFLLNPPTSVVNKFCEPRKAQPPTSDPHEQQA